MGSWPAQLYTAVETGERDVITTEDGARRLAFLRGLAARGLGGTTLVVSDAHPGLVDAMRSTSIDKVPGGKWRARWREPSGGSRSRTFTRRVDAVKHLTKVSHDVLTGC